jgi:hypothetical protein
MQNIDKMTLKERHKLFTNQILDIKAPRYKLVKKKQDNQFQDAKLKIKNEIRITADMFYSDAFKSLSRSAIITLMRCLQKRKWEVEGKGRKSKRVYLNNGFIFPYAEAAFLDIGTTQHWKNINKLIAVGFLDLVHQGGWYQKHEREKDYSVYQFSERWRKYGTPEFEEVKKEKSLREDCYIRQNIERQKLKLPSLTRRGQLYKSEGDSLKT